MAVLANVVPATSGAAIMSIVDFLLTVNWTVPNSWNGTAYTVNATPGVNPLTATIWNNNASSGLTLQSPDGRQITMQRSSSSAQQARFMYSPYAGFRDGWITCVAKASLADGQTVTLTDSNGGIVWVGEWDTNGIVTPGRTPLDISTATTAVECAAVLAAAVTANCPNLTVISTSTPTLYFVKTVRTGYLSVAVSGGITAFAPRGTFAPVAYTASGAEQGIFFGGGTDQSPTFENFLGTAGTYRLNGCTVDSVPYTFAFSMHNSTTNTVFTSFFMDRVSPKPDNSWDDAVLGAANSVAGSGLPYTSQMNQELGRMSAWVGDASSKSWGAVVSMYFAYFGGVSGATATTSIPNSVPADAWTTQNVPQKLSYFRRPAAALGHPIYGWVGNSTVFAWNSATRNISDLLDTPITGGRACFGNISMFPWNNTAVTQ